MRGAQGAEEEEEGEELDEEGENKVGGVVREYLSIHDNDEAKLCVQELYAKGYPKARVNVELVKQGLMQAMDAGEREGELIGQLVAFLVKEQIITEEAVGKGFVAVLADLPGMSASASASAFVPREERVCCASVLCVHSCVCVKLVTSSSC